MALRTMQRFGLKHGWGSARLTGVHPLHAHAQTVESPNSPVVPSRGWPRPGEIIPMLHRVLWLLVWNASFSHLCETPPSLTYFGSSYHTRGWGTKKEKTVCGE